MTITLTALHEQLLKDTCRMLQYDINALTPAQEVRLSRAAMLRLELDDCATKKLAGQPFDTVKYIAASENLERLIGSDPEQTTTTLRLHRRPSGAHPLLHERAGVSSPARLRRARGSWK